MSADLVTFTKEIFKGDLHSCMEYVINLGTNFYKEQCTKSHKAYYSNSWSSL